MIVVFKLLQFKQSITHGAINICGHQISKDYVKIRLIDTVCDIVAGDYINRVW